MSAIANVGTRTTHTPVGLGAVIHGVLHTDGAVAKRPEAFAPQTLETTRVS